MRALADTTLLQSELARVVGAEHVLSPADGAPGAARANGGGGWAQYRHDATRARGLSGEPDLVVRPGDTAEVAAVLALCYERDVPLIPRGGGTGLAGGAVALGGGVVCALERLRRVRELEPALWRMLPEAGVCTRHVQRLARENGLFFPPDPGASEQSQIGGNVATNAGGPHAFKHGVTGDWVTGLEAVIAPGETIAIGGAQRKDVAGYDLKSLLIGSEGTLGIVTAVRLRLAPAPEAALPLIAFFATREQGCAAILDVLGAGIMPAALDFLDGESLRMAAGAWVAGNGLPLPLHAELVLLAEVDGTREAARAAHAELAAVLGSSALELRRPDRTALWEWRDRVPGAVSAMRGGKVSEDVVVPVERLAEALARFEEIAARRGLRACAWGHGADGNIHANMLVDPRSDADRAAAAAAAEELFALAVELGGSISGEHGVGWCKGGQLARQWPPGALRLHEEIKRAFDPKGLLNPGKKLARLP
ncbi:MAG TPA: FAD-linked oxidase C-terminal domain-containing protein [Solirubrobacteraceae bacterium]|jgi:glycolate oxidase subunit GlcD|nr:FAD-linked oxidase C-terminal domain-containing protein [Solirubrobacteraceae bacterium]